ncbi:hypothetical protein DIS24_g3657 [Lasiodiplodia hormozganensis]|uniref:Uncharacterized protein n=1 Tax=Lasiodiplodia hormozganensis TaxID=869390 RepID=A0AA39YXH5_9PEZI|nr:hypothetical protein DIS24_g3657 [Lasiodiplodia hormozganensis]
MSSSKPSGDKAGVEPTGQPPSYSAVAGAYFLPYPSPSDKTSRFPKPRAVGMSFSTFQQLLKEQLQCPRQLQEEEEKEPADEMELNGHENSRSGKDNSNTENQEPLGPAVSECGVERTAEQDFLLPSEPLARSRVQQPPISPVPSEPEDSEDAEDAEDTEDDDALDEEEWDSLSRSSSSTMANGSDGGMWTSWDEETLEREQQLRRQQEEAQAQQAAIEEREALNRRAETHRKIVEALSEACGEHNEILAKLVRCQQETYQKVKKVEDKLEEQNCSSLNEEQRLSRSISRINDYLGPFEASETLNTSLEEHRNLLENKKKAVMDAVEAQAEKTDRLMGSVTSLDSKVVQLYNSLKGLKQIENFPSLAIEMWKKHDAAQDARIMEQANNIEQLRHAMMHETKASNARWETQIADHEDVAHKIALLEQQFEAFPTHSGQALRQQEFLQQLQQANNSTVKTLGVLERRANKLETSHAEFMAQQTACEKNTKARIQELQTCIFNTANALESRNTERIAELEQRFRAWAKQAMENKALEDRVQALCGRIERLESENKGLKRLVKKQSEASETAQRDLDGKVRGIRNDVGLLKKESNAYQRYEPGTFDNRWMFG